MEAGAATSRRARYRSASGAGAMSSHRGDVRPSGRFATGRPSTPPSAHNVVRRNRMRAHRRSIRLLPAFALLGRAAGAGPGGFGPGDDDGARRDHHRRRRRDLVGGCGRGRDPRRHVGEAGGRGHPRAAADRRPGCRADRLRGPVRRRARRSEGRVWRLRDHRRWRFGLRDATSGAGADRRARTRAWSSRSRRSRTIRRASAVP